MIQRNRGSQFDPKVVDGLLKVLGNRSPAISGQTVLNSGNGRPASPSLSLDAKPRG